MCIFRGQVVDRSLCVDGNNTYEILEATATGRVEKIEDGTGERDMVEYDTTMKLLTESDIQEMFANNTLKRYNEGKDTV